MPEALIIDACRATVQTTQLEPTEAVLVAGAGAHRLLLGALLVVAVVVVVARIDAALATRLLGAADVIRADGEASMTMDEAPEHSGYLERLRTSLNPDAFEEAWIAGRSMSQSDAVALAVAG